MNHAFIEKECFPHCYLSATLIYFFFFSLSIPISRLKKLSSPFFFLLYLMLPINSATPLSETLWNLSADYLLVITVEFLYPDNGIFIFTKVCSFLHNSYLKTVVFLLGYLQVTLSVLFYL